MHTPTQEQQACIDAFFLNDTMKVGAYAGAAKTSTLEMMAHARTSPGVYLCFNKAIAEEAGRRFPEWVACRTTHSFAFRSVISYYRSNSAKMTNNRRARDTVDVLGIRDFATFGGTDSLDRMTVGFLVNETVKRYCQSADEEIGKHHFHIIPKVRTLPEDEFKGLRDRVVSYAKDLWIRAVDPGSSVALSHDGYVKVWQLSKPIIDACYVMVDESQDTNPVMLDVLANQDCQVVYVGDKHQQIYEWRGAVNAMETVKAKQELYLTKSFRFGQRIADFASEVLSTIGETRRIVGNELVDSDIVRDSQRTILCRTNGQILNSLIECEELTPEKSIHVVGGVGELLSVIEGVERLQSKKTSAHNLFMGFNDWQDFLVYADSSGDTEAEKVVTLIDKYGVAPLKSALLNVYPSEDKAEILLTTAHKSKGREWSGVELADDFRVQPEKDPESPKDAPTFAHNGPETRLFYVAATRAKHTLKVPQWAREEYGLDPKQSLVTATQE